MICSSGPKPVGGFRTNYVVHTIELACTIAGCKVHACTGDCRLLTPSPARIMLTTCYLIPQVYMRVTDGFKFGERAWAYVTFNPPASFRPRASVIDEPVDKFVTVIIPRWTQQYGTGETLGQPRELTEVRCIRVQRSIGWSKRWSSARR